jgi:hypothetical protein
MINIVTSVCIDVDEMGKDIVYPQLDSNIEVVKKREVYWRCATTFCMSSIKVNNDKKHLVFTNDPGTIIIDNHDVKKKLTALGVEIIEHPFDKYDPKNHSKRFRNAFYKLEVINLLSAFRYPSILLDADSLWTKKDDILFEILCSGQYLLLQDTYQRSLTPDKKKHNLSMEDMGILYKTIPINMFKSNYPVWYGGELIGANPEQFKIIGEQILQTIEYCKNQNDLGNKIQFNNGFSIFDGDEFISSYVYNSLTNINIFDTYGKFSKRLWTNIEPNNVRKEDIDLTIWHLHAEKNTGLKELFYEIIQDASPYWSLQKGFADYLGRYIGIPKRTLLK